MKQSMRHLKQFATLFTRHRAVIFKLGTIYFFRGIFPTMYMIVLGKMINQFLEQLQPDTLMVERLLPLILLLGTLYFLQSLVAHRLDIANVRFELFCERTLEPELVKRHLATPYEVMESEDYKDQVEMIFNDFSGRIATAVRNTFELLSVICSFLLVLAIVASKNIWIGLGILAITLPLIKITIENGKNNYAVFSELIPLRRKNEYKFSLFNSFEFAEERLVFDNSEALDKFYDEDWEQMYRREKKLAFPFFMKINAVTVFSSLVSVFTALILIVPVYYGQLSIGFFIALLNALMMVMNAVSNELLPIVEDYSENWEYMAAVGAFYTQASQLSDLEKMQMPPEIFEQIRFEHVSFKYPGATAYTLKDVSFELNKGSKYAFFGENGSGKSTIIKLLLGLYGNYEGNIYFGELELRTLNKTALRSSCNLMLQDFNHFAIPVFDFLNLNDGSCEANKIEWNQELKELLGPEYLADSLMLGNIHQQGIELSGGQWQKLLFLRCKHQIKKLFIFDEPCASLDCRAEKQFYQEVEGLCKNDLAIFISHRMGSVFLADEIFVIHKGSIEESGEFRTLVNNGGLFSHYYHNQKSWYEDEEIC